MYFLALSQAPPPLVIWIATKTPTDDEPTSIPPSALGPSTKPTAIVTPPQG